MPREFSFYPIQTNKGFANLSLERLEDRSVPALLNTSGTLWFYQNMGSDPALAREAISLWQGDNKTFQYKDMVKLFHYAASEHATIQQNDLTALRNLVSHASAVGWMPDYVANLSGKVLNYNLSNEFYQFQVLPGGQPMSPNLLPTGVLQAGNSSSLLNTLVNKWFLGLDHPDMASIALQPSGNLQGEDSIANSSSVYLNASGVLWGSNGPSNMDLAQGIAGDCYFLSGLGATVSLNPKTIQNMFINNGNGTYTIRFYLPSNSSNTSYQADYVTVDTMLPFDYIPAATSTAVGNFPAGYYFEYANGGPQQQGPIAGEYGQTWYSNNQGYTNLNTGPVTLNPSYPYPYSTNVLWVSLLEKAYAQFNSEIPLSNTGLGAGYNLPNGANSYYVIGEGGWSFNTTYAGSPVYGSLSEILGQPTSYYVFPSNDGSLTQAQLASLINSHQPVTISSYDKESGSGGKLIVTGHVYYLTAYNPSTQIFTAYNPWGYKNTNQGKSGILNYPFEGADKSSPSLDKYFGWVGFAIGG